jgi:RNA polymerase sigma factor (sigma-70 family)
VSIGKDGGALRRLRALYNVGAARELSDGQLLERFASGPGEVSELAFAALVERHGAMVLRVCRGVLSDPHEAQDAFQATFLVLVVKARGLWVRESLGPWLHQVAYRTASCARRSAALRRRHERRAAGAEKARAESVDELGRALHEEVERLPTRYRLPVVLCDLEGRTHEQAARHLGWPVGTIKSRLSRGRDRLRDRLRRRGLAPESAPPARPDGPAAMISPALIGATSRAAVRLISTRGYIEGPAALLAREVLRTMMMTRWLKIASVVLVLGAAGPAVELLAQKAGPVDVPRAGQTTGPARDEAMPVVTVRPGKLGLTLVERGTVEASQNHDAYNRVEGQRKILSILPEGTVVKKGQLVCELDSSDLTDKLKNQKIATLGAAAAFENAKLTREVAEITEREFLEKDKKKESDPIERYTKDKTIKELRSEVEKARSDEVAKQAAYELEKDKEVKLETQIKNCKIFASGDGPVVHANDPNRLFGGRPQIAPGAPVRERQKIFSIPDLAGQMRVNTKVHESSIERVKVGQPARILVDTFPGEVLTGKVAEIAPLPDPRAMFSGNEPAVYTTRVAIDQRLPRLRPGMSARVEILVNDLDNELDDVLSVPITALIHHGGKDRLAVKKPGGGFEWREVTLGVGNDEVVEVKKGLRSGDVVALRPLSLLSEQEKREIFGTTTGPAAKPGRPK